MRCAALGLGELTAAVIANIETGRRDAEGHRRRDVTVDELLAIALALDVPPVELQLPQEGEAVAVTPNVDATRSDLASWLKAEINSISPTLLRGLALCGSCRAALLVGGDSHERTYFCANRSCPSPVIDFPVDKADGLVSEVTLHVLQRHDVIEKIFLDSESADSSEISDSRLAELSTEITQLKERRADTIRTLENLAEFPQLNADVIARSIASFDSKILEFEQAVTKLKRLLLLERNQGIVRSTWMAMPTVARRTVVETLIAAVVIPSKGEMRIEWLESRPGMFCPDCGEVLDDVDMADPCPSCGGNRRSANALAQSAMGSGTVLQPTIVTHSYPGDVGEQIDVGAPRYRSSSIADPEGGRQDG